MSDSPKPSAPAGISDPAFEVEIPDGLFFDAGDYTVANARPEDLAMTRRNVSRHRSKLKASVALQLEDFSRVNAGLHAADRQGNAAPHWDSAVALAHKLLATVKEIASTIDKAERRYEATFLIDGQEPAAGPEAGTPGEALAVELQRLGGPLDHGGSVDGGPIVVTMNGSPGEPRHYPRSMAEAMSIRNAKLSAGQL